MDGDVEDEQHVHHKYFNPIMETFTPLQPVVITRLMSEVVSQVVATTMTG